MDNQRQLIKSLYLSGQTVGCLAWMYNVPEQSILEIIGHRDMSAEEIALLNEGKALAEQCRLFATKLQGLPAMPQHRRWLAIAITDLQKGFMSMTQAFAKPTSL